MDLDRSTMPTGAIVMFKGNPSCLKVLAHLAADVFCHSTG